MPGIRFDFSQFAELGNLLGAAGKRAPEAIARGLNHTGAKARTQMVRVLTDQTGLKRKVIVKALKVRRASSRGALAYVIESKGGDISLKYFDPVETERGVSAAPHGRRRVFVGTFLKGGRFPKRVALHMGGHVFIRVGGRKLPIEKVKSGVVIPAEMISGHSAEAFEETARSELGDRLRHELLWIITGRG